jgi:mono/diheme cytochrome c family protein
MPPFSKDILSDEDLADIYAYLQAIPKGLDPSSIPLLNP